MNLHYFLTDWKFGRGGKLSVRLREREGNINPLEITNRTDKTCLPLPRGARGFEKVSRRQKPGTGDSVSLPATRKSNLSASRTMRASGQSGKKTRGRGGA